MVGIAAPSVLDAPDEPFALRICGSSRDGQIVRLRSAKCTIGSGPRSTLRLRARGVQPTHCLVLRGPAGTMIRRFAADTRVNGGAFTDARLVPGDRLGVGPLEFEVLDPRHATEPAPAAKPAAPAPTPPEHDEASPANQADLRLRELDALAGQLAHKEHALQRRGQDLEAQQRAVDQQQEVIDAQKRTLEEQQRVLHDRQTQVEQQQRELQQRSDQLDAARAEVDAERAKLAAECPADGADLDSRQHDLDSLQSQLHSRQAELDSRQADLEARQAELASQHAECDQRREQTDAREAQLDAQAADLATRQSALDAHREELAARETEQDEREAQLRQQQAELGARRAELDARESEIDEAGRQAQATQSAPEAEPEPPSPHEEPAQEAPSFEEPTTRAPASSAEVLRRLGMAAPLDDEEEPAEQQAPSLPSASPVSPEDTAEPGSPPPAGEEETIDDYMARLLDRVRAGTGRSGEPASPGPSAPPVPAPSTPPAPEPSEPPPEPQAVVAKPPEAVDLSPRAVAPERSVDLSAMRDLANYSAKAAIDHHARRRLVSTVSSKLIVMLVSLAASAILLWVWATKTHDQVTLYAALASLVVAVFWAGQYVFLDGYRLLTGFRRAIADFTPTENKPAKPERSGSEPEDEQDRSSAEA